MKEELKQISARVTEEELVIISRGAKYEGLNVSSFIRRCALIAAKKIQDTEEFNSMAQWESHERPKSLDRVEHEK